MIRNLVISNETYQYIGLFGRTGSAEIKNVGLEGTYIAIDYLSADVVHIGGICASSSGVNSLVILNCYNIGIISISSSISDSHVGGIIGDKGSGNSISNCYNQGKMACFKSS